MELFDVLQKRHTVRNFTGATIPAADLEKMVDAGIALFVICPPLRITAIGMHFPDIPDVGQLQIENFPERGLVLRRFDGGADLDPAFEVTFHEIGGADVVLFIAAVLKIEDPGMLKKSADQGNNRDIFRQSFDAGPQTTGVADDEVDADPGHRGPIERLHHVDVFQRVGFELNEAAVALFLVGDFPLDFYQERLFQLLR